MNKVSSLTLVEADLNTISIHICIGLGLDDHQLHVGDVGVHCGLLPGGAMYKVCC